MTGAFVITGTDTDVGKTVFAAGLAGARAAYYWKPIQAGLNHGGDRDVVARLSGLSSDRILPEAYRLKEPCSPHRAAEMEGIRIEPEKLVPPANRPLIIEGAGGALVPITRRQVYADLFARWALPTVIVARTTLGTINHSLLTIEALQARGVSILGLAFVGDANEDSERTIVQMSGVRRLGRLPLISPLSSSLLAAAFETGFRIEDFR